MPISNTKDTSSVHVSLVRSFTDRIGFTTPKDRNLSESTVNSGTSKFSKASNKETPLITSTWGIGWQTPALMLGAYVHALVIAIIHLVLFRYLNGKEADGPNEIAPQSYISTASNILANLFGFSIRGALAVAFVQYLWYLLRIQTMKVSTIELLFNIRSNLFVFFRPSALRATPVLFVLAGIIWASQVVTSFPPGAITVISSQKISYEQVSVPTFNASFMGNGSGVDASKYSLPQLAPFPPGGFTTEGDGSQNSNLLNRLARQVLIGGESFAMPSPCGANCSYTMEFEGPWMECTNSTTVTYWNDTYVPFPIYAGEWLSPLSAQLLHTLYNGTYTLAQFNSSTLTPLAANHEQLMNMQNASALIRQDNINCSPGRARFQVNNTYVNNVQSRNISVTPIDKLINLALLTYQGEVIVPGICAKTGYGFGTGPANWTDFSRSYYRDNNIMAIFSAMMSWMSGKFLGTLSDDSTPGNPNTSPGPWFTDLHWTNPVTVTASGLAVDNGPQNGTIVDSTRFNAAFGQYSAFKPAYPSFNVTQDMINDYLFNMTTSIMMAYGEWNTTANATKLTTINIYSFSQPLNLILPYFLTLLVSLPFILVGGWALLRNGVSAMDGSFIQIITTSTGSAVLDNAAAGGCLGGNESIPQELKDLKIRFGEFIGREEPGGVKRAGFGTESEVTPLQKGANYGIARWI